MSRLRMSAKDGTYFITEASTFEDLKYCKYSELTHN